MIVRELTIYNTEIKWTILAILVSIMHPKLVLMALIFEYYNTVWANVKVHSI